MSKPKLIVMSGLPGSGKSLLAESIAGELHIPILSVDPIASAIIKSGAQKNFDDGLAAYQVAETLAKEQLKLGNSVIIDAVNAEDEPKEMWRALASRQNAALIIIECHISDTELHKTRIQSRTRNLHGISEVSWDKVQARRKKLTDWHQPTLKIDSIDDVASNWQKALEYIRSFN